MLFLFQSVAVLSKAKAQKSSKVHWGVKRKAKRKKGKMEKNTNMYVQPNTNKSKHI